MIIRKYKSLDCKYLAELFYQTVHTINTNDYTKEQLDVWATGKLDLGISIKQDIWIDYMFIKIIQHQGIDHCYLR